jgi:hypothetical protein
MTEKHSRASAINGQDVPIDERNAPMTRQ